MMSEIHQNLPLFSPMFDIQTRVIPIEPALLFVTATVINKTTER